MGTEEENRRLMIGAYKVKEVDLGMRLESRKVDVLIKVGWKSCAVTCSAAEDVVYGRYPNSSKNTINIKRSLVFFSSFVSILGCSSLLLFRRLKGLDCHSDCWSSHRWCDVNSGRSRSWLVRILLVKQANEFSKMLDRWSWLPGILFF